MTLVSSIINDSLRETNIIALGQAPTSDQNTEGLTRLQALVSSVLGNEAGENLYPFPVGKNEINAPKGYPWYANEVPGDIFLPVNLRLMFNLDGEGSANLHPKPSDGARMGVVDVSQTLGTYPFVIYGNGRSIEGSDTITLDESGISREWFYRGDLGNWVRVTDIALTDEMPFPKEFDDMFVIMLASRLNPRYGQTLDPDSRSMLVRARGQFRARYKQDIQMPVEDALLYLSGDYRYGGRYPNRSFADPNDLFNAGYPY